MLRYSAEVRILGPDRLIQPHFVIRNVGADTVAFAINPCDPGLRAYRSSERVGRPVWAQERWPNPDPRTGFIRACDLVGLPTLLLAPDDSVQAPLFQMVPSVAEVLGDSLPVGRYYFTARITTLDRARQSERRDSARVSAGELTLTP